MNTECGERATDRSRERKGEVERQRGREGEREDAPDSAARQAHIGIHYSGAHPHTTCGLHN